MALLLKDDANYPIPQLVKADGNFVPARGTDDGATVVYDETAVLVQQGIRDSLVNTTNKLDSIYAQIEELKTVLNNINEKVQKSNTVELLAATEITDNSVIVNIPAGYAGGYAVLYVAVISGTGTVSCIVQDNSPTGIFELENFTVSGSARRKIQLDTDTIEIKIQVVGTATVQVNAFLKR